MASKAAGESKPEAYPQGYVEDFDKPRTTLADFFSILLAEDDGIGRTVTADNGAFEVGRPSCIGPGTGHE